MVNHERLDELLAHRSEPCVTVTLPTAVAGPETQQGPIRLKNLIRRAADALGDSESVGRDVLHWMTGFLDDDDFWQHQREGLMLLGSAEHREVWRMPFELPETVHVGDRFHLKHAIHVANSPHFEVLAFSRGAVRMFACDASYTDEIELEDVPASLEEFLRYDDFESQLQAHASKRSTSGDRRPEITHHGHGGTDDRHNLDLDRFATAVAKAIDRHRARRKDAPTLVLCATTRDAAAYRNASSDPRLAEGTVEGNHDRTEPDRLRELAWPIVEDRWKRRRNDARERVAVAGGHGKATNTLNGVLSAAHQGRVDTLFVAADVERHGSYDPISTLATVTPEAAPTTPDLLDEAACVARLHGADVYVVPHEEMPEGEVVAAALRS